MKRLISILLIAVVFLMSCNNSEKNINDFTNQNLVTNNYEIASSEYLIWKARHMRDSVDDYISKLSIKLGPIKIIEKGQLSKSYIEDDAAVYMKEEKKIDIIVDLILVKKILQHIQWI